MLRKQARQLENEIDLKLVAFSKIGAGSNSSTNSTSNSIVGSNNGSDSAPLLGEHIFDSLSEEIAQKLEKVSESNYFLQLVFFFLSVLIGLVNQFIVVHN